MRNYWQISNENCFVAKDGNPLNYLGSLAKKIPWWKSVYNACVSWCVVRKQRHNSRPKCCDSFDQRHRLICDAGLKNDTSRDATEAMVSAMDYWKITMKIGKLQWNRQEKDTKSLQNFRGKITRKRTGANRFLKQQGKRYRVELGWSQPKNTTLVRIRKKFLIVLYPAQILSVSILFLIDHNAQVWWRSICTTKWTFETTFKAFVWTQVYKSLFKFQVGGKGLASRLLEFIT